MTDPNINPWYIPGWTDQNNLPAPTGPTGLPSYPYPLPPSQSNWPYEYNTDPLILPSNIPLVTVTANYGTFGYPRVGGSVLFELLSSSLDNQSLVKFIPSRIRGWLFNSVMTVKIPAGFTYRIREMIPGGRRWNNIVVPYDQSSPIDLNYLVAGITRPGIQLVATATATLL